MFGWRRRGKVCWTVTDGWERWYPVKVRVIGRGLWRFRLFDLIGLENSPCGSDRHGIRLPVNGGKLGIIGLGGIESAAATSQRQQSQLQ